MKFDLKGILEQYPGVHIGVLVGRGLDNSGMPTDLKNLQKGALREAERQIGDDPPTKHPHIASWRDMYRSFGTKPGDYRPSAEALIRRSLKNGSMPKINAAVDLYNIVSVKHVIPMGGFDLNDVVGGINLRISEGGEKFLPLGASDHEETYTGEVVYADDERILTRRWNYRDCDETKITSKTSNLVMFVDASPAISVDSVSAALDELKHLLTIHCGGSYETWIAGSEKITISIG